MSEHGRKLSTPRTLVQRKTNTSIPAPGSPHTSQEHTTAQRYRDTLDTTSDITRPISPRILDDGPVVCIAHGRFIPCRKQGPHRYTDNPYWVKAARDYQGSSIPNLTWEPAWE